MQRLELVLSLSGQPAPLHRSTTATVHWHVLGRAGPALPRLAVPGGPGSAGQLLQQSQKYWQDLPARLTRAGSGTALPAEHMAPTWMFCRSEP